MPCPKTSAKSTTTWPRREEQFRLPFSAFLNNPELTYRIAHVGSYIRFDGLLPDQTRELAIMATAREIDARFEWAANSASRRDAIANRKAPEGLGEDEALPIRVAQGLLRDHAISDELFAAAHAKFGDAGVVELLATVGYYSLMGCVLNGLQIEPPPEAAQLPK